MSAPSLSIYFHTPTVDVGSEGPSLPPRNKKKKKGRRQEPGNYGQKGKKIFKANERKKQKTPIRNR
jgi:hypothetical protein